MGLDALRQLSQQSLASHEVCEVLEYLCRRRPLSKVLLVLALPRQELAIDGHHVNPARAVEAKLTVGHFLADAHLPKSPQGSM